MDSCPIGGGCHAEAPYAVPSSASGLRRALELWPYVFIDGAAETNRGERHLEVNCELAVRCRRHIRRSPLF